LAIQQPSLNGIPEANQLNEPGGGRGETPPKTQQPLLNAKGRFFPPNPKHIWHSGGMTKKASGQKVGRGSPSAPPQDGSNADGAHGVTRSTQRPSALVDNRVIYCGEYLCERALI